MILYPPEHFDINEWFTIISAVFGLTIAWVLPKRFSPIEITVLVVFTIFMSQSVDSLIAVKPYDLYDVNDGPQYELMDVAIYYLSYPPFTYIFLYFYDKWKLKGLPRIFYIIGFSVMTVAFEWLAFRCHVFTYKGWKLLYSPFVYIGVYTLCIYISHVTRKLITHDKMK